MAGRLSLLLTDDGGRQIAKLGHDVHLANPNLLTGRGRWVEELEIALFDPGGHTAARLEEIGLKCRVLKRDDAIASLGRGILIVGENASFDATGNLAKHVVDAAAHGVNVVCLAPQDGRWRLPAKPAEDGGSEAASIGLHGKDILLKFDKRLPGSVEVAKRFALSEKKDTVSLSGDEDRGWAWVDVVYGKGRGRLILCGFALLPSWEESPGPRLLLLRILETLHPWENTR